MSEGGQKPLLVIGDDALFLEIARVNLERRGFEVQTASDPHEGINLAIDSHFDLILLELVMPGLTGEKILSLLKPLGIRQPILVVSGHSGETYRSRVRDLGAVGYLQKPVTDESLYAAVLEHVQSSVADDVGDLPAVGKSLDWIVSWVFSEGRITTGKRLTSWGVVVLFGGVITWLIWG